MIRIAWYTALVLTTLMILVLLWQFSAAVIMLFLSLALSAALRPFTERLIQKGLRKALALGITYGLILVVLGILFFSAGGQIILNLQQVIDHLFVGYETLKENWLNQDNQWLIGLAEQLPAPKDLYNAVTGNDSNFALQSIYGTAQDVFEFLARVVIVVVMSLYWSIDHIRFERLWLSLLPVESRLRAREIWYAMELGVGAYIRREGILSLVNGVLLWLSFISLGIHYATLLAFIGSILRLIPWLGVLLVFFLPILAGSSLGIWGAAAASALTLVIYIVLEKTIGSRLFPRSQYNSLLLGIVVIMLADSNGIQGAIIAPVLAVTLEILIIKMSPVYQTEKIKKRSARFLSLEKKMEEIKHLAAEGKGEDEDDTHLNNLVSRLDQLIKKSEGIN